MNGTALTYPDEAESPLTFDSPAKSTATKTSTKWGRRFRKFRYYLGLTDVRCDAKCIRMPIHLVLLVLFWIGNNVIWVFVSTKFSQRWAYFADQITTFWFVLTACPVLAYKMIYTKDITPEMRAFPWKRFLAMGFLDGLYNLGTSLGSVYTSGPFQVLLFQIPIPLCMGISMIFLHSRYVRGQYVGAAVIFVGSCVAIIPSMINPDPGSRNEPLSLALYTGGVVAFSFSAVYKEWAMKNCALDVWYLFVVVGVCNFFISFGLIVLDIIPGLSDDTWDTVIPNFVDGFKCYVWADNGDNPDSNCSGLVWLTVVYCTVQMLNNIWMLIVINLGDSVIMNIAGSVQLPLSNLIFAVPAIMGSLVTTFTNWNYLGMGMLFIGTIIYQYMPLEAPPEEPRPVEADSVPGAAVRAHWDTAHGAGPAAALVMLPFASEQFPSGYDRVAETVTHDKTVIMLDEDYFTDRPHLLPAHANANANANGSGHTNGTHPNGLNGLNGLGKAPASHPRHKSHHRSAASEALDRDRQRQQPPPQRETVTAPDLTHGGAAVSVLAAQHGDEDDDGNDGKDDEAERPLTSSLREQSRAGAGRPPHATHSLRDQLSINSIGHSPDRSSSSERTQLLPRHDLSSDAAKHNS